MKNSFIPTIIFLASLFLVSCEKDQTALAGSFTAVTDRTACSVDPVFQDDGPGGNVDCPAGYAFTSGRINIDQNAPYPQQGTAGPVSWTISADGKYLSWSGEVCGLVVVVKGGPGAHVYTYDETCNAGSGLFSPPVGMGNTPQISNITFCWNVCDDVECQDETAWAAGNRYVSKGNWATYTPYAGVEQTVTLWAGQTNEAGTVHFSAPVGGVVTVTIILANGWTFNDVDENVKIQDYAIAPSGNPSPGLFAHKATATNSPFSIDVPQNNFYGVHVDVTKCE